MQIGTKKALNLWYDPPPVQQANLFAVMQPFILSDVAPPPVNQVLWDNTLNIACQTSGFRKDWLCIFWWPLFFVTLVSAGVRLTSMIVR